VADNGEAKLMCALLVMCAYSTAENGKLKYLKQTVSSLLYTVDLSKHMLVIVNNSTWKEGVSYLNTLKGVTVLHQKENLGTARGINIGIRMRQEGEIVIKCDDDLTWGESGWVEKMEQAFITDPKLGIVGLKRDDIPQNTRHPNPELRTVKKGDIEYCHDIMGTCTAYNPKMLDKCGYLFQHSPHYSFDDNNISVRSEAAGFRNAFLWRIPIVNLDEGGTEYTEWKKREAGVHIQEHSIAMDMIKNGQLSYYWDGGLDD
jgi:GT2 family glycosyltransferase